MEIVKEVISTITAKNDTFKDKGYPKDLEVKVWVSSFTNEERIMVYPRQMHGSSSKYMTIPSMESLTENFNLTKEKITITTNK